MDGNSFCSIFEDLSKDVNGSFNIDFSYINFDKSVEYPVNFDIENDFIKNVFKHAPYLEKFYEKHEDIFDFPETKHKINISARAYNGYNEGSRIEKIFSKTLANTCNKLNSEENKIKIKNCLNLLNIMAIFYLYPFVETNVYHCERFLKQTSTTAFEKMIDIYDIEANVEPIQQRKIIDSDLFRLIKTNTASVYYNNFDLKWFAYINRRA